jgi:hypothetical protein
MQDRHAPREEFVERLADQIRDEFRRRPAHAPGPRWTQWLLQSPVKAAVAVALLVVLSMSLGGIVVAAAYQAQNNEQRSVLIANFEQRLALAGMRLEVARRQLTTAQDQMAIGVEGQEKVLDGRFKVIEAEADVRSIESQLAEVRETGHEPLTAVSSSVVNGRDFVTERWRIELTVPEAALDLEKARLDAANRRFSAGVGNLTDVLGSQTRIRELEVAVQGMRRKLEIRQRFLKRELDATMADLRVLEAEADVRRQASEHELARKVLDDASKALKVGIGQPVELAEAELRVRALELNVLKATLDLKMIQQQIARRQIKR